jgi:hypothetical protein
LPCLGIYVRSWQLKTGSTIIATVV